MFKQKVNSAENPSLEAAEILPAVSEDTGVDNPFGVLTSNALVQIVSYLNQNDHYRLKCSCRFFNALAKDRTLVGQPDAKRDHNKVPLCIDLSNLKIPSTSSAGIDTYNLDFRSGKYFALVIKGTTRTIENRGVREFLISIHCMTTGAHRETIKLDLPIDELEYISTSKVHYNDLLFLGYARDENNNPTYHIIHYDCKSKLTKSLIQPYIGKLCLYHSTSDDYLIVINTNLLHVINRKTLEIHNIFLSPVLTGNQRISAVTEITMGQYQGRLALATVNYIVIINPYDKPQGYERLIIAAGEQPKQIAHPTEKAITEIQIPRIADGQPILRIVNSIRNLGTDQVVLTCDNKQALFMLDLITKQFTKYDKPESAFQVEWLADTDQPVMFLDDESSKMSLWDPKNPMLQTIIPRPGFDNDFSCQIHMLPYNYVICRPPVQGSNTLRVEYYTYPYCEAQPAPSPDPIPPIAKQYR